jgi:hypothetical protein
VPGPAAGPFSIQFVRVPYDVEAELSVAEALGMPELDAYQLELRHGIYRGNLATGEQPEYHRP